MRQPECRIRDRCITVSEAMEQHWIAAGLWDSQEGATEAPEARMEAMLALMIAFTMANSGPATRIQGKLKRYTGTGD